ncbi:MAG: hypothetical protein ACHQ1H_15050, partial [Nitrososphaerales archaeon]
MPQIVALSQPGSGQSSSTTLNHTAVSLVNPMNLFEPALASNDAAAETSLTYVEERAISSDGYVAYSSSMAEAKRMCLATGKLLGTQVVSPLNSALDEVLLSDEFQFSKPKTEEFSRIDNNEKMSKHHPDYKIVDVLNLHLLTQEEKDRRAASYSLDLGANPFDAVLRELVSKWLEFSIMVVEKEESFTRLSDILIQISTAARSALGSVVEDKDDIRKYGADFRAGSATKGTWIDFGARLLKFLLVNPLNLNGAHDTLRRIIDEIRAKRLAALDTEKDDKLFCIEFTKQLNEIAESRSGDTVINLMANLVFENRKKEQQEMRDSDDEFDDRDEVDIQETDNAASSAHLINPLKGRRLANALNHLMKISVATGTLTVRRKLLNLEEEIRRNQERVLNTFTASMTSRTTVQALSQDTGYIRAQNDLQEYVATLKGVKIVQAENTGTVAPNETTQEMLRNTLTHSKSFSSIAKVIRVFADVEGSSPSVANAVGDGADDDFGP